MKKIEVSYYDYETGAESPIDVIEVEDDYTVEDYIEECNLNMEEPWDTENGEIRFCELEEKHSLSLTIKHYQVNSDVFVDGQNFTVYYDGILFDDGEELKEWINESVIQKIAEEFSLSEDDKEKIIESFEIHLDSKVS